MGNDEVHHALGWGLIALHVHNTRVLESGLDRPGLFHNPLVQEIEQVLPKGRRRNAPGDGDQSPTLEECRHVLHRGASSACTSTAMVAAMLSRTTAGTWMSWSFKAMSKRASKTHLPSFLMISPGMLRTVLTP